MSNLSIYSRRQFRNGRNFLKEVQTEGNYVASFLAPLFHRLLRDTHQVDLMWYDHFTLFQFLGFANHLFRGETEMNRHSKLTTTYWMMGKEDPQVPMWMEK